MLGLHRLGSPQCCHSWLVSRLCLCSSLANPVNKVSQLRTNLEAKIKAEGMDAHEVHEKLTAWCNTQSSDLTFPVRNRANLVRLGETPQTKVDKLGSPGREDSSGRAIAIIEKEMKEGASIMQLSVIDALSVMVQALSINFCRRHHTHGVGTEFPDLDDIVAAGASHSSTVETSSAEARQTEAAAIHNFQLLRRPRR